MHPRPLSRGEFLSLTSLLAGSSLLPCPAVAALKPADKRAPAPAAAPEPLKSSPLQGELLRRSCRASLCFHSSTEVGTELIHLGEWMREQGLQRDIYGQSEFIQSFERGVAERLGFEEGCFMPTGTMGQLIALRIYADEGGLRTVGLHPSSHHVMHEDDSYTVLHELQPVMLGTWSRPILAKDLREARERMGTVSLELPVRWLGGQLQTWEQLEEIKHTCRERGVKLHMDGARLWESQPFYGRSYADICRGFDSVYVSFYKMVGALGGAMVVGNKDFIRTARLWRHRHGGNVYQLLPYVASAAMRLESVLGRIPAYVKRAKSITEGLAADPRLVLLPLPVQTNLFHVFLRGDAAELSARRDRIAREDSIWLTNGFGPTRVPGILETELQVGEGLAGLDDQQAVRAFLRLLEPA